MDGGEPLAMVDVSDASTDGSEEDQLSTSAATHVDATNTKNLNTVEDLMDAVGTNGRWNFIVIFACVFSCFPSAFSVITYQFLGATPDYWCNVPELTKANWTQEQIIAFAIPTSNSTGKHEGCLMHNYNYTAAAQLGFNEAMNNIPAVSNGGDALLACHSRVYNTSQHASSVVTEWDLTCERRALYSTTSSVTQAGTLIGSLFYGHLMESIGRRKSVLFSSVSSVLVSALTIFSPNVETFIFFRMMHQAFDIGYYMGPVILCMEVCSPSQRTYIGSLFLIPWAVGYMIVPGVAYLVRPWRWMQAAFTVPILYSLIYFWLFPESPRWLILHGRFQDVLRLLKKAASVNCRILPPDHVLLATMENIRNKDKANNCKRRSDVVSIKTRLKRAVHFTFALLLIPGLRVRVLIVFYLWIAISTIYYGVSLNSYNLSTNIYLYTFLGGLLEIPAYVLLWLATTYMGRRKTFAIIFFICGVSIFLLMALMLLLPEVHVAIKMILSLSGKMAITAAFALIWYYTTELFSTKYRTRAIGEASMFSRIGSASSPYINDIMGEVAVWAPSAVFSLVALLAAAIVLLLPETTNKIMPQENDEEEEDNELCSLS